MKRRALVLVGALMVVALPASADLLHLEGGGVIATARWWIEGDTILYESGAGTVGIPRALVVRIEPTEAETPVESRDGSPGLQPAESEVRRRAAENRRAEALAAFEEGKAALEERDFETASTRFLEAIRSEPRLSAARVGYALSEISQGHDGLALSVVLEGLRLDPDNGQLHELLGDLRNREERVEDALASWRKAFSIEPGDRIREKIMKAERELEAGRDLAFATTPHFNVRYDAVVDVDLATAVIDYLEQQFWVLADRLRHTPRQPITVLLYPTREFRDVTRATDDVAGLYDGKIRVPLGGLDRVDPRAKAVLTHELTHAVIHSKTRGNCPRWLHEGLAQLAEERPSTPADRGRVAEVLAAGDPETWAERGFSYPAALSLTRYLVSLRGEDGVVDLLGGLGGGESLDDALLRVYRIDYPRLCREWARALSEDRR